MNKKKLFTTLACIGMTAVTAFGFVGCNNTPTTIWSNDFNEGNAGAFVSANITDNVDGTITLNDTTAPNGSTTQNYTYFGNEDKNLDWEDNMTISLKMKIENDSMTEGDYIVWSLALNGEDGNNMTEFPAFFVKGAEKVKFVYEFTGVDSYPTVTNSAKAVELSDDTYELNYIFSENKNDEILIKVTLKDSNGNQVFTSENEKITVINNPQYTAGDIITEDMVGGLRYLWLTRNSVAVTLDSLTVTAD